MKCELCELPQPLHAKRSFGTWILVCADCDPRPLLKPDYAEQMDSLLLPILFLIGWFWVTNKWEALGFVIYPFALLGLWSVLF